ncbi:hypothetical protein E2C01_030935 [Portunus trituberculatus]|uniref:Uncharacterized protein n=1 Tax=Portunus trituberculatus TaxID=210409 RepID=A0A5B7EW90_PORTR|nr:hypothetical protein [Portunus trituberculatus]
MSSCSLPPRFASEDVVNESSSWRAEGEEESSRPHALVPSSKRGSAAGALCKSQESLHPSGSWGPQQLFQISIVRLTCWLFWDFCCLEEREASWQGSGVPSGNTFTWHLQVAEASVLLAVAVTSPASTRAQSLRRKLISYTPMAKREEGCSCCVPREKVTLGSGWPWTWHWRVSSPHSSTAAFVRPLVKVGCFAGRALAVGEKRITVDDNLCNAPCKRPTHSVRLCKQQQHTLLQQLESYCTGGGGGWVLVARPTPPAHLTVLVTHCGTRSVL